MKKNQKYAGWQTIIFWLLWSLLLIPLYFATAAAWIVGSLLKTFNEPMDILLTLIFMLAIIMLVLVIFKSWRAFINHTHSFSKVLGMVFTGLLVIPLLTLLLGGATYVQFNNQPMSYYQNNYDSFMEKHASQLSQAH